jgi:glycosyltransferase involved in cell wall biosynthesis
MRVGVIARRLVGQPFGIGRYIQYLLRYWDRVAEPSDQFVLYTPTPLEPGRVPPSDRFHVEVLGPAVQGIVWENLILPTRVKQVDVLFGPSYTVPLTYRGPMVVATHSVNEATPESHPWWYRLTYSPWYRASARRARRVIVPSHSTREDVRRHYGIATERIDLVPEGVDESFLPVEDRGVLRRTRERYFGTDRPYILFVGKQSQRRNIPNLIAAFGALKRRHDLPHGLLLLGPNVLGLPLGDLAREHGVADSVVQLDESFPDHRGIIPVYAAADLYVYPSAYDGFSLTLVEAMACGVPAVTVRRAALTEIANGSALMVEEPTVEALTEAMERGLLDPELRTSLRARGLERARALQWKQTAQATLDVLRCVAEEARR